LPDSASDSQDLTMDLPGPDRGGRPGASDERRRSRETAGLPRVGDSLGEEEDLVGRTLGGYRVISRLGRGAVGTVYLAEQLVLQRPVALKVLSRTRAANSEYVARFEREAHAVAKLVHPSAVQVYDIGEADGYHYIALEYIDGESVSDLLERRGRISWRAALEIVRQAASSLARAHELGIVHRDIKPENLMLSRRGEVKVADFGLARLSDDPSITRHGTIMGTPFYMSPEQAQGESAGCAADIYSLGCTLYHMLAGHPPFEAVTALDVVHMHTTTPARPPQEADPAIPSAVGELALQMMAKRPENRPESAARLVEIVNELRRSLDREPGAVAPQVPAAAGAGPREALLGGAVIREMLGPEGRTYRRVPVDMVASARPANLPEETRRKLAAKVLNVSRGGLFLACAEPSPAGTLLEFSFRPSADAEVMEGLAVVRWVSDRPLGMGLEFVRLSPEEKERIATMVARSEAHGIMEELTRTELHERLLRTYYTNLGSRASLAEIAERAGTTVVMVREGLRPFVHHELVRLFESRAEFRPAPNEELSGRIKGWVLEHGLG
jgi:predicted Ser/Thr protein kinase